jgi:hypothetical protein
VNSLWRNFSSLFQEIGCPSPTSFSSDGLEVKPARIRLGPPLWVEVAGQAQGVKSCETCIDHESGSYFVNEPDHPSVPQQQRCTARLRVSARKCIAS